MGVYIFVLAAAIAVFGILVFFKKNVELIKEDPEKVGVAQRNFFIGAAISEAIPIVLLILGFVNIDPVPIEEIYTPIVIVIALIIFSVIFIFLQRAIDVDEDSKMPVTTFSMVAVMVTNAIPIIALVFLFLSIQS